MIDLLIHGGKLVTPQGIWAAEVAVDEGRVVQLLSAGERVPARSHIDAQGLYVLPGLIDAHVHLREPGLVHKESISSGTQAAACAGVTTVLDMPNTLPPVTTAAALTAKGDLIAGQAWIDVGLYAALTPQAISAVSALAAAGCLGFKLFLGPTTGDLDAPGWGELSDVCREIAGLEVPLIVHAEERDIIDHWTARCKKQGVDYADFLASRPEFGEVATTATICRLAQESGAHIHIAHVTLAAALAVIARAKSAGWPVTAETCPPYLFLTAADYEQLGTVMKILPPIRERQDQKALWAGLASGDLDMVATDHAPHLPADKQADIWTAAAGAPGVETLLPLLLEASHQGRCTLSDIVRWCCWQPARIFALRGKGSLLPGDWADIVLVDLDKEWQIRPESLHSKSKLSPFVGWQGRGAAVTTLLRGTVVAQEGQVVGEPQGRWWK